MSLGVAWVLCGLFVVFLVALNRGLDEMHAATSLIAHHVERLERLTAAVAAALNVEIEP